MPNRLKSNLFIPVIAVLVLANALGLYWQHLSAARQIPQNTESIVLGMGCFWGAEKRMSALPGVVDVLSGYAGGSYPDPTYRKILAREGRHDAVNYAEVVKVIFDPAVTSVEQILVGFWENHNPTQGNRQGHDVGSNYRSAIYYDSEAQKQAALMTRDAYQKALTSAGFGTITTEIAPLKTFYPAEEYHQDYLVKHPNGYCGLGGTGVKFPSGIHRDTGAAQIARPLDAARLSQQEQLIVFEAEHCPFCKLFREQVLDGWHYSVPVTSSLSPLPPTGWELKKDLWATPTIVLFRDGKEVSRYTGYNGEKKHFRDWLGANTLPEG
jgi:peptide methionine sulfoxide reductase msrA/msrB